jgi:hypothetical protein
VSENVTKSECNFLFYRQLISTFDSVGPCSIQEDGTPVYCGVVYFGEQAISATANNLECVDMTSCTNDVDGVSTPIEIPIVAMVA